jgi:hypothetical protein
MSHENLNPNERLMLITDVEELFRSHINDFAIIQNYSNLEVPCVLVLGGEWRRDQYGQRTPVSIWRGITSSKLNEEDYVETMAIKIGQDSYELTTEQSTSINLNKLMTDEELMRIRFMINNPDVVWSRDVSEILAANSQSQPETNI